ncbi:MAG TPA: hypothetical protein PKD72_03435 [Gemmatales bacterium]|nr:hypothetical protein [Gemmatales bacterium]
MFRIPILVLLAVVPATLAAIDAPMLRPAQDKTPNLFPLIKGSTWEFEVTVNGMTMNLTQECVDVTKKDDGTHGTLTTNVNGQKIDEEISVNSKGIYRHSISTMQLDKPIHTVKYPVAPQKWTESIKLAGMDIDVSMEMKAAETVNVPAGNYKNVTPVIINMSIQGQEINATNYYAEGVGIIKQEMNVAGTKVVSELKKYTPGSK